MGNANTPKNLRGTIVDNIQAPIRTVWLLRAVRDLVFNLTGFPDTNPGPISVDMNPFSLQSSIGQETVAEYQRSELIQYYDHNAPDTSVLYDFRRPPQFEGPLRILRKPGSLLPPPTSTQRLDIATGGYQVAMHLVMENELAAGSPDDLVIEIVVDIELAPSTAFSPAVNFRRRFRFAGGCTSDTISSLDSFDLYTGDAIIQPTFSVVGVRRLAPTGSTTTPIGVPPPEFTFLPNSTRYFNGDGAAGGSDLTGRVRITKDSHIWIRRLGALTLNP